MNYNILDLYSDYLLSSFGQTTATGLARLLEGEISHDQVTRMLASEKLTAKTWWKLVKPQVRQIEREDGVMIVDDSIVEKPYTDENEIICWHYDHAKDKTVKGINFITTLYEAQGIALPVSFVLVAKTETYLDKKTGKEKRKSAVTKNEHYRRMLQTAVANRIPFRYVLNDVWFASAENMRFVKLDLEKEFIMGLKGNRKVALSEADKANGQYQRIEDMNLPEGTTRIIYLEGVPFPLQLLRQVFTNGDGSTGVRYLVTSDLTLSADQIITIYQRRWRVEEYHRSLKQNMALTQSPTRTETTQTNHFVAALWSFVKMELLKVRTKKNHYQLKNQLYLSALQQAFHELQPSAGFTGSSCYCVTSVNKGSLFYDLDNLEEAEAAFWQAELMLRQQKGLLPLKALVANNLGCVLRKRQEWSAAGRYHQQSINLYRQIGNKLMLANAIGNFAKLYKLQRRYPEALRYFDEAMALAVQFPDNIWAKERLADFAKNKTELIREMEGIGMTSS